MAGKLSHLGKLWEPSLQESAVQIARARGIHWHRRVRLVAGNFSQCPKSQSDFWGKTGTAAEPFGQPKAVYVNVRVITDAIPHRYLNAASRIKHLHSKEEQAEEFKKVAARLQAWINRWIEETVAPRLVEFVYDLDRADPDAVYAQGRDLFTRDIKLSYHRTMEKLQERQAQG